MMTGSIAPRFFFPKGTIQFIGDLHGKPLAADVGGNRRQSENIRPYVAFLTSIGVAGCKRQDVQESGNLKYGQCLYHDHARNPLDPAAVVRLFCALLYLWSLL
jgi:hypothetical protein